MTFNVHRGNLEDSLILKSEKFEDERGSFIRAFDYEILKKFFKNFNVSAINISETNKKGTLRGLHFQKYPFEEIKIIRCLKGKIFDVAVDLRRNSSTFGMWQGIELNAQNRLMFYVPKGFAHGFITLKEKTEIIYLNSEFYAPEFEITVLWSDPLNNIRKR